MEFQLQHQSFKEYSGLISFRMDWLDLLAVQGTLKDLLHYFACWIFGLPFLIKSGIFGGISSSIILALYFLCLLLVSTPSVCWASCRPVFPEAAVLCLFPLWHEAAHSPLMLSALRALPARAHRRDGTAEFRLQVPRVPVAAPARLAPVGAARSRGRSCPAGSCLRSLSFLGETLPWCFSMCLLSVVRSDSSNVLTWVTLPVRRSVWAPQRQPPHFLLVCGPMALLLCASGHFSVESTVFPAMRHSHSGPYSHPSLWPVFACVSLTDYFQEVCFHSSEVWPWVYAATRVSGVRWSSVLHCLTLSASCLGVTLL